MLYTYNFLIRIVHIGKESETETVFTVNIEKKSILPAFSLSYKIMDELVALVSQYREHFTEIQFINPYK